MNEKDLIKKFEKIRKDFPILSRTINSKKLIYVDNAATTQKTKEVIDSQIEFYTKYNSNVHRGVHSLSEKATHEYEKAREKVAKFINSHPDEIIFTSGTTDSINKISFGIAHKLKKGDEIVLSSSEHHANLVCWQEVCKITGAKLKFIKLDSNYNLDMYSANKIITNKTKIISISHISNVLGSICPLKDIVKLARKVGAITIIDSAQSICNIKTDVKNLDVDFLVFSGHKMLAPTGVGVLYGKKECLEELKPTVFGGSMIYEVSYEKSNYAKLPQRLEAGTPNICGVIGLRAAIDYLNKIGLSDIEKYEKILTKHFLKRIKEVKGLTLYGSKSSKNRFPIFSFEIKGIHSHDVCAILNKSGIAIRGGHHCAMPLAKLLGVSGTSRISLSFYNTKQEIDYIIECLKKVYDEYEKGDFLLK